MALKTTFASKTWSQKTFASGTFEGGSSASIPVRTSPARQIEGFAKSISAQGPTGADVGYLGDTQNNALRQGLVAYAGAALPAPVGTLPGLPTTNTGWKYARSAPASATQASITIPGVTGQTIVVAQFLVINIGSANSGSVSLAITDGSVTLSNSTLTSVTAGFSSTLISTPTGGIALTPGQTLTVTVGAGATNSQWLLLVFYQQY